MSSKKTKVVDGFTAIRAAQEAARHGRGDPLRPEAAAADGSAAGGEGPESRAGTRIGRSVMPTKREIVCPACGALSEMTGKLQLFVCTACKHRMKLEDVTLPEGDWSGEIETGGNVVIPAETRVMSGKIVANDVLLQGKMAGAEIRACRRLTVEGKGQVDWVRVQLRDLEVGAGVRCTPGKAMEARHLIVHGIFSGNIRLEGTLTVRACGDVSGQVRAAGLEVEEGGGLRASLDIRPENAPKPEPKTPPRPAAPPRFTPRGRAGGV